MKSCCRALGLLTFAPCRLVALHVALGFVYAFQLLMWCGSILHFVLHTIRLDTGYVMTLFRLVVTVDVMIA